MADTDTTDVPLDQLIGNKPSPGALLTLGKDIARTEAQKEKAEAPVRAEEVKTIEEGRRQSKDLFERIEPFNPPPAPDQRNFESNPVASFGSLGSIFGIIASAFTHAPMINAMNAAAASINAIKQNDWQNYRTAYQAWKDNTELALQRHKLEQDDWRLIVDKNKDDIAGLEAEARAFASKYDDRIGLSQIEAGMLDHYFQVQDSRARLGLQMKELMPRLMLENAKVDAYQRYVEAQKKGDKQGMAAALNDYQLLAAPASTMGGSVGKDKAALVQQYVSEGMPLADAIRKAEEDTKAGGNAQINMLDAADDQIKTILGNIDDLSKQSAMGVTGVGGLGSRTLEWFKSIGGGTTDAPAHDFASEIETLKLELPKLLTGTSRSAVDERSKVETILGGLGPMSTVSTVTTQLKRVQQILNARRTRIGSGASDSGTSGMSDADLRKALGLPQ